MTSPGFWRTITGVKSLDRGRLGSLWKNWKTCLETKGRQLNKFRSMQITKMKLDCFISLSCLPSGLQSCFQAVWSFPSNSCKLSWVIANGPFYSYFVYLDYWRLQYSPFKQYSRCSMLDASTSIYNLEYNCICTPQFQIQ